MKYAFALMMVAGLAVLSSAGYAATGDDNFDGPYFNEQSPAAFGDNHASGVAVSATSDQNGSDVSKIEPAAGDSVFTLPEDPSDVSAAPAQTDTLAVPSKPIVPGMTVPNNQP